MYCVTDPKFSDDITVTNQTIMLLLVYNKYLLGRPWKKLKRNTHLNFPEMEFNTAPPLVCLRRAWTLVSEDSLMRNCYCERLLMSDEHVKLTALVSFKAIVWRVSNSREFVWHVKCSSFDMKTLFYFHHLMMLGSQPLVDVQWGPKVWDHIESLILSHKPVKIRNFESSWSRFHTTVG